jgi:two-component system chemotaxis response regulator CheB
MVVDDSAIVRGLIIRMLEGEPSIAIAASVGNGAAAVAQFERDRSIDVIVLDIEMPVMDGLEALQRLVALEPCVQVVMASTLTQRNAEVSLKALQAGAADYVPKPTTQRLSGAQDFARELVAKVKVLGARRRQIDRETGRRRGVTPAAVSSLRSAPKAPAPARPAIALRPATGARPDVIAIGCSTGGPQALQTLFAGLRAGGLAQPILITQHMPAMFTTILADHLQKQSGRPCSEATDGTPLVPGQIVVARGDWHMRVESRGAHAHVVRCSQEPPENFCRPAVDPMLRSVAQVYGSRVLAVILTGMGSDGLDGGRAVVAAGGTLLAQDEATSVVWGMPGAVATAGLCTAVLPLGELAAAILKRAAGG